MSIFYVLFLCKVGGVPRLFFSNIRNNLSHLPTLWFKTELILLSLSRSKDVINWQPFRPPLEKKKG